MELQYEANVRILFCQECKKEFFTTSALKHHIGSVHQDIRCVPVYGNSCRYCKKFTITHKEMRNHIKDNHPVLITHFREMEIYIEPMRNLSIKKQNEFVIETDIKTNCVFCREIFAPEKRIDHYKTAHGDGNQIMCNACNHGFKNWRALDNHLQRYDLFYRFKCVLCEKGYKNVADCRKHVQREHWKEIISSDLNRELDGCEIADFSLITQ